MNLYPAIDIRGGQAVRLTQGDYGREKVYDASPVEVAERWVEAGAGALHVVDLDGAREGRPVNADLVAEIARCSGVPVQVGGGLRDDDAVAAVLDAGAARAVLGTAALADSEFLDRVVAAYGDQIVVSADARSGRVAVEGWTEATDLEPGDVMRGMAGRSVATFVYTPVEVDGTLAGPPLDQLRSVASSLEGTGSRMIYSGGVGEIEHLEAIAGLGESVIEGVIVGKALYERRFTVAEALQALDSRV